MRSNFSPASHLKTGDLAPNSGATVKQKRRAVPFSFSLFLKSELMAPGVPANVALR